MTYICGEYSEMCVSWILLVFSHRTPEFNLLKAKYLPEVSAQSLTFALDLKEQSLLIKLK